MSSEEKNGNLITENSNLKVTDNEGQKCPIKSEEQVICPYKKMDNENNLRDDNNNAENSFEIEEVKPKKCLFIELNKDVSYFNLSTFYLVQFSYVASFTFIDACQDHLLESEIYDIDKDKVGTINGDILLYDTLYLIAFIYIYGTFHDVFGRKILIVFGFLSMSLSLFLHPLAGNVYPNLILVRLIFSNGICAVTTQPLLADYINHKTKGFAGGIVINLIKLIKGCRCKRVWCDFCRFFVYWIKRIFTIL